MLRIIPFLLKPLLRGAIELIFFAPIWLSIAVYTLTPKLLLPWSLLLLLVYSIPQYIWHSGKVMKYGVRLLLILLFGIIPAFLLELWSGLSLISLLACGFVGILFAASSFRSLAQGWPNSFTTLMMVIMLVGAIALQVMKVIVMHDLAEYNSYFFILGILACVLFLYIQNERMIRDQQMIDGTSSTIRRSVVMNRIYITCITLLVASIAVFRNAQEKVEQWLKQLLAWLFREREQIEQPQAPPEAQAPVEMTPDLLPQGEPGKLWVLLEQVLKWLVTIALIAAVAAGIYYFVTKVVPMLIKLIYRLLNQRSLLQQSNEGYQDEIEGINPEKSAERRKKQHTLKSASLKRWHKLSAIEKLKALFVHSLLQGLRHGEPIKASNTAKQNLTLLMKDESSSLVYGDLLKHYNNMRYGSVEPDEEKLQQLREKLEEQQHKSSDHLRK